MRSTRASVGNAGGDASAAVARATEHANPHRGFDAAARRERDLVRAGVVDPTKVVRTALRFGASAAMRAIAAEAIIAGTPGARRKAPADRPAESGTGA